MSGLIILFYFCTFLAPPLPGGHDTTEQSAPGPNGEDQFLGIQRVAKAHSVHSAHLAQFGASSHSDRSTQAQGATVGWQLHPPPSQSPSKKLGQGQSK